MKKNRNFPPFFVVIATGFGLGYVPKAPGTAGALLGIVLGYFLNLFSIFWAFTILLMIFFLSCYCSTHSQDYFKKEDPQQVVIDEIVGMAISLLFLPLTWKVVLIQFILFRIFDIFKPFPVKQMEEIFSGGLSIMMDDVLAGIIVNFLFRLGSLFLT